MLLVAEKANMDSPHRFPYVISIRIQNILAWQGILVKVEAAYRQVLLVYFKKVVVKDSLEVANYGRNS